MTTSEPPVSYARNGADVILWRALGGRGHGVYVDVGARDPSDGSMTRAFYEHGWRGVNIEPRLERFAAFERDRPEDSNLGVAVGDRDGTVTLLPEGRPASSSVQAAERHGADGAPDGPVVVPIRRLDTLFQQLGIDHVDVLVINAGDVAAAVVRGLVSSRVRPLVCVVAGAVPECGPHPGDEAIDLLSTAGYLHCLFDGFHHYLTTDPALVPSLSVPVNPSDANTPGAVASPAEEGTATHATRANLGAGRPAARTDEQAERLADDAARHQERSSTLAIMPMGTSESSPQICARLSSGNRSRSERRLLALTRLLSASPGSDSSDVVGSPPRRSLVELAGLEMAPVPATSALYEAILGREADEDGLAAWSERLARGASLLTVARELASSEEAGTLPLERRAQTDQELREWASREAVEELGIASGWAGRVYAAGTIAQEIFVRALFEVTWQRQPSPSELGFEVRRMLDGAGRERLLREYAARPEVRWRLLGTREPGLRGWIRHRRDASRALDGFRLLVGAAEDRQVAQLVADVARADVRSPDLTRRRTHVHGES